MIQTERTNRKAASLTESELQNFLMRNPGLIPAAAGGDFSRIICIGREVQTDNGCADCIFVSPSGLIAVVVSNMSAAQIIACYEDLQERGIDGLDAIAEDYSFRTRGQAFRVLDLMAERGFLTYSDESEFIGNIGSSSILFLAVGSAIKSQAEEIGSYLSTQNAPAFNIVFIER